VLRVFTDVVLPVFAIAAAGGLVGRWRGVQVTSLTAMVFYLFSPALVFDSLSTTELSAALGGRILAVIVITWTAMFAMATTWSRIRRHDAPMRAAVVLAATTANSGNMGVPVARLAFGELGLQIAVVNYVATAVLANSAGIAVASTAIGHSRKAALTAPLRYPYVYAAVLGLLVRALHVDLPVAVRAPVETLAGAAIPVMLVVLGLQLRDAVGARHAADTAAVGVGRLIVAPALAWTAATAVGLRGVDRGAMTVLAAMPVAVITTILATEFRARVDFVTRVVVVTTLASVATLTILISLVR
jgi:predicted permease